MHTRLRRTGTTLAVIAGAALVAVGCGEEDSSSAGSSGSTDSTTTTEQTEDAGHSGSSDAMAGMEAISSPGTDLRLTVDRLLGEHAGLALVGLNKVMAGEQDADAVITALEGNTEDLSAAIGSVYGDDAADAFQKQWEEHIGFFAAYATGVAKKDEQAKKQAKAQLAGYQESFSRFLNEATGLNAEAAAGALGMHVQQLTAALDQFGAGNYPKAYAMAREAYAHMYGTGDALSAAISKQKPDEFGMGDVSQAAADTRILLGQQLGEHAMLSTVALTKTMAGAKDAGAAVEALEGNTVDLGDTIGSVYGPEAQEAFLKEWRDHIGFFVNYAMGVVEEDEEKQEQAKAQLGGYVENSSKLLEGATGAEEGSFKPAIQEHVDQVIAAVDAAGEGDAEQAWELEREAYAHMFMTSDALTNAIVVQNPDKFGGSGASSAKGGGDHSEDMDS